MKYQVTGNEYISLPTIREHDGVIEGLSCLYMGVKGMIELTGREGFIRPFLLCDGNAIEFMPRWQRDHYWIPSYTSEDRGIAFRCTYLAPLGERGFGLRLEVENQSSDLHRVRVGVNGSWDETLHTVNESIPMMENKCNCYG